MTERNPNDDTPPLPLGLSEREYNAIAKYIHDHQDPQNAKNERLLAEILGALRMLNDQVERLRADVEKGRWRYP